jgi:membrane protein required for colicin V production
MTVDLAALALLAVAAIRGALSGALRQLVSLAAAALGIVAARALSPAVADGLARSVAPWARAGAPVLLFAGTFALASLVGALVLHGTGVSRVVRGPADRGAGALLGGAKGALAIWAVLSAVALAADALPRRFSAPLRGSDFVALARDHNLVSGIDAGAARRIERGRDAARGR